MECVWFVDDLIVLAKEVLEVLEDLDKKCEEYGIIINKKAKDCLLYTSRCV